MADFRHIVTTEEDGEEVRVLMRRHFDLSSRLRGKVKRGKLVFLNGSPAEGFHRAKAGDELSIVLPEEKSHFIPEDIPIDPVYEDDDLLIINKQPGLIVHPTKGHGTGTVANALMYYMQQTGKPFKIRFVNRLDMDTSGLLVVAKNAYCQNDYVLQTKKNQVKKIYTAVVRGIIEEEEGVIDLPIGFPDPDDIRRGVCEGGAPSLTRYRVAARFEETGHTLVRLLLETGLTHQIRVHMSHIGHPVVSDSLYGIPEPELIGRQALHAASLTFTHPVTKKELHAEAPLPEDMKNLISRLR